MAKSNNLSLDLSLGFYQSESLPFANQRCVNLFPNVPQTTALRPSSLFSTEGLRQVASVSPLRVNACRGAIRFQNKPYFVFGNSLYRVDKVAPPVGEPVYTTQFIGSVNGGSGRVSMAENGTQIIIINDEGIGWIYEPNASPSFFQISDAGFTANGTPKYVVYVDRYFIVTTDTKRTIISAVGDGTNWNAIDSITAEADTDDVVAPFVHKNQLYLLGTTTTEQYRNRGGAGVPFVRVNGFILDSGCSAPFSVVNVGPMVFWVGRGDNEKAKVLMFTGSEPQIISTNAIEDKLHDLTDTELESVYAYAYSQRGNTFIHFTTPYNTFVYNPVTTRWHERESEITLDTGGRITTPCRITTVIEAFNDLLVGDNRDGRIGIIDRDVYTEYGEPYISWFTTQPLSDMGNAFTLPCIQLACETGIGDSTTPDPKVRMQISRDGVQFENPLTRSLGRSGDRKVKPTWNKNGRCSEQAVFKITVSDPVPRRFYSLDIDLKRLGNG